MENKIFISYNQQDKEIIDTIARKLDIEFGRNNIFYDGWSITPGDSIIGKMNEGLSSFEVFFFFISQNSLDSNMVKLEWQTALNRVVNNNLKFVGVRLDDCSVPTILSDKLYIDLYNEGIDNALIKMKQTIKNKTTYLPLEDFINLNATVKQINNCEVEIKVDAKQFVEYDLTIAIGFDVDFEKIEIVKHHEGMVVTSKNVIVLKDNGKEFNCLIYKLTRPLKPGHPFEIELKSRTPFMRMAVFKEENRNGDILKYDVIPTNLLDSLEV